MASTNTGETILQAMIRRGGLGLVLLNADIGGIAAGTVTSVLHLRNNDSGFTNEWRNKRTIVYRPGNATGAADYVRYAADLTPSTGVLAVDTNWSDTTLGTENVYLLEHNLHPTYIVEALNRALEKNYFPNISPLSLKPVSTLVADADFQNSSTIWVESDADGGAATTHSKVTTANSENVFPGMIGSGRIVNTAADGYIRQRYAVSKGEHLVSWVLSRVDSGTDMEHVLYDNSNSAEVGTVVSHAQEAWQWTRRDETVPADCELLELRIRGEGASDDIYVNAGILMSLDRSLVILDTTWKASQFEIPTLFSLRPKGMSAIASNVYEAFGMEMVEIPRSDYDFLRSNPAANPHAVQFHNGSQQHWFQWPVYIQGRRSYSDIDSDFTLALTGTTSADLDLIEAAARVELFLDERVQLPDISSRLNKALRDLRDAELQNVITGPAKAKPRVNWNPGSGL